MRHWEKPSGRGFVYFLRGEQYWKIGRSKDPRQRLNDITVGEFPVSLFHQIKCTLACDVEHKLHGLWAHKRVNGEWFAIPDEVVESWRAVDSIGVNFDGWDIFADKGLKQESQPPIVKPGILIRCEHVAEILGVEIRTLADWRLLGKGPPFVRISNKCVRYRKADLDEWVAARVYNSTTEASQSRLSERVVS